MTKNNDDEKYKYSPARLYEFVPGDSIAPNNIVELCKIIRVGVGGHVLKEMSEELQAYFKEVA